jgi:hypothetical protein
MKRELNFRAFDNGQMLKMPISNNYGISRFFGILRDDAIIMQYTGSNVAGINGTEVFEGDIIENCNTKELQEVYWNEDKSAWWCSYIDQKGRIVSLNESLGNLNEVVGNIYEGVANKLKHK